MVRRLLSKLADSVGALDGVAGVVMNKRRGLKNQQAKRSKHQDTFVSVELQYTT